MSYSKSLSESPSATTGVSFFPDAYTQQSIAESAVIPIFITTEANIPNGFTAVPEKRVSDIIEELNTYACGQKQLKELNTLCDDKGFEIQFVYPDEQKNENEYALKLNESISSFVSSDDSTKKIIYICVNKEPPPSVERNVCIYDKSTGIIEKTKTYIIQDNPIKSDAYRVGHELSHATVFISFLSDIKSCFEQYVELMGTSQSNMFQIQIKDTSELKNEHQKQFLQDILSNCAGRCFSSLKSCFLNNNNTILKLWQDKHHENLLSKLKNNFNLKDDKILKSLFFNGEEARNLLGLDESMSSNESIGEFHYINESYQKSHGTKYNIIRMPYDSKIQWNKITDYDETIKSIFQKKFCLRGDEIKEIRLSHLTE